MLLEMSENERPITAPRVTGRRQNVNYLQMYYGTPALQNSNPTARPVRVDALVSMLAHDL